MKVEEYQFSSEEIVKLKKYRDEQPDARLQRRFLSLIMLAEGVNIEFVMKVFDISHRTLQRWFDNYIQIGIESLNSFQYQPKKTSLNLAEESQLKDWVKKKALETEP